MLKWKSYKEAMKPFSGENKNSWLKLVSPLTDDLFVNTRLMLEASEVSLKSQDILWFAFEIVHGFLK